MVRTPKAEHNCFAKTIGRAKLFCLFEECLMGLAKILAPLTGTPRDNIVLATAYAAAAPFQAHVAAVFVHPDARLAVPLVGVPVSPDVVQDIVNVSEDMAKSADQRAHAAFVAAGANASAAGYAVTSTFRRVQGLFFRAIAHEAELSDLVVFGVITGPDAVELSEGFVEILTRSGRPILLSAEAPSRLARKVVLGWDGGASAARAISASLPFLKKAESVEILSIRKTSDQETRVEDLREYLGFHGVKTSEKIVEQGSRQIGEALLEDTAGCGADLLVMGAYRRGPLRESVFGGATAHIRSHATLPIFLAH